MASKHTLGDLQLMYVAGRLTPSSLWKSLSGPKLKYNDFVVSDAYVFLLKNISMMRMGDQGVFISFLSQLADWSASGDTLWREKIVARCPQSVAFFVSFLHEGIDEKTFEFVKNILLSFASAPYLEQKVFVSSFRIQPFFEGIRTGRPPGSKIIAETYESLIVAVCTPYMSPRTVVPLDVQKIWDEALSFEHTRLASSTPENQGYQVYLMSWSRVLNALSVNASHAQRFSKDVNHDLFRFIWNLIASENTSDVVTANLVDFASMEHRTLDLYHRRVYVVRAIQRRCRFSTTKGLLLGKLLRGVYNMFPCPSYSNQVENENTPIFCKVVDQDEYCLRLIDALETISVCAGGTEDYENCESRQCQISVALLHEIKHAFNTRRELVPVKRLESKLNEIVRNKECCPILWSTVGASFPKLVDGNRVINEIQEKTQQEWDALKNAIFGSYNRVLIFANLCVFADDKYLHSFFNQRTMLFAYNLILIDLRSPAISPYLMYHLRLMRCGLEKMNNMNNNIKGKLYSDLQLLLGRVAIAETQHFERTTRPS